jgi:hypothetical protein
MPTGWRPDDVKQKYPVATLEDVYHFEKYDTHVSGKLLTWSWIQLSILLAFTMDLFLRIGEIGFPGVLWYGLYLFVSIFSITALMDKVAYAPIAEVIRFTLAIFLLYSLQWNWFGISSVADGLPWIVFGYALVSLFLSLYFHFAENRNYQVSA